MRGGFVHGGGVQSAAILPRCFAAEGVFLAAHVIGIFPFGGIETGMRIVPDAADAVDGDVVRQHRIQLVAERFRLRDGSGVEMGRIVAGMYARVRSSRTRHRRGETQDGGQGAFEFRLDGGSIPLYLPAVIIRPLIG